jgi:hypothetical protein
MSKAIIALCLLLGLSSCYDPKTHGAFITEHQDAWIDGYTIYGISEHRRADKGLLFCRANVGKDGLANPICFKPNFEDKVGRLVDLNSKK